MSVANCLYFSGVLQVMPLTFLAFLSYFYRYFIQDNVNTNQQIDTHISHQCHYTRQPSLVSTTPLPAPSPPPHPCFPRRYRRLCWAPVAALHGSVHSPGGLPCRPAVGHGGPETRRTGAVMGGKLCTLPRPAPLSLSPPRPKSSSLTLSCSIPGHAGLPSRGGFSKLYRGGMRIDCSGVFTYAQRWKFTIFGYCVIW